jgi:hypothetical protein
MGHNSNNLYDVKFLQPLSFDELIDWIIVYFKKITLILILSFVPSRMVLTIKSSIVLCTYLGMMMMMMKLSILNNLI